MNTAATKMLALATAAMLDQLKESRWYRSAPAAARQFEPEIEITGVEFRKVRFSEGIMSMSFVEKPFLTGKVTVGGITAQLALRLDFGMGGLVVDEVIAQ